MIPVKIKLSPGASVPGYQSDGAAGADMCALVDTPVTIEPGRFALIPTGIRVDMPFGYEAQIRPRSGLSLKHGIMLLNSPGTIDSDYRGEIKIIMANFGTEPFTVERGMRIAQMVFAKVYRASFLQTEEMETTERNEGGFGHSGI